MPWGPGTTARLRSCFSWTRRDMPDVREKNLEEGRRITGTFDLLPDPDNPKPPLDDGITTVLGTVVPGETRKPVPA